MASKPWTKRQEVILRKEYPACPDLEKLAKRFKRTMCAMKTRAVLLKIRRVVSANTGRTSATPADDRFIMFNYLTMPVNVMAARRKRSETLIKNRMRDLGLVVPDEIIKIFSELSRFSKGTIPANKSRKWSQYMSKEGMQGSARTWFKKGNIAPNRMGFQDGDIQIRLCHEKRGVTTPHQWIRLSLGKWYPMHQYLWELSNGPLPKGHCLWFMDGDTMNCSLDNLELITRAENMRRNSCSIRLTDNYIANTLARKKGGVGIMDRELAEIFKKDKDLLETARQAFLLKRTIKEKSNVES